MIDFATLKSLTVPEGNVKKITDESGNVLWEAPPSGVTVTITKTKAGYEDIYTGGHVMIDGVYYREPTSLVVPLGTVIVCPSIYVSHPMYGGFGGQIKLNGTLVASGGGTYEYTVNKDVEIAIQNVGSPAGIAANINITES